MDLEFFARCFRRAYARRQCGKVSRASWLPSEFWLPTCNPLAPWLMLNGTACVRACACACACVCACVCVCVCMYIDEILRVRLKSALLELERASDDSHVAHIMQPTPQALPIKEHLFLTMQVQTNDAVHPGDSYGNISFFVNARLLGFVSHPRFPFCGTVFLFAERCSFLRESVSRFPVGFLSLPVSLIPVFWFVRRRLMSRLFIH